MKLIKENGYTLLEIIITMGLIAIAIGMSGFGLNVVFNSNVRGYANDIANDIRLISTREMASSKDDYEIVLSYDGGTSTYNVTSYVYLNGGATRTETDKITLPKNIQIFKGGTDLNGMSTIYTTIRFDPLTGRVNDESGIREGSGIYELRSINTSLKREIHVEEQSGRVYVYE